MSTTTFPTLYSRTATGAIQQWQIVVDGDSYYVMSGQVGGQLVTSTPRVCKPKNVGRANATTAQEQAVAEARSKWDKKAETGYSEDINQIDNCIAYVEPMLAKELSDYKHKLLWDKGLIVQRKFNGMRTTARLENGRVVLRSRKGKEWVAVPHLNEDLAGFFDIYPDAVLDGELFNNELRQRLNDLSSLIRKTSDLTSEDLQATKEVVRFYAYDGFGFGFEGNLDAGALYTERKAWIDSILPLYSKYYSAVVDETAYCMADVDAIFRRELADGQEGVIVRVPDSPYEAGKRSKYLLKYKPVDTDEGIILSLHEGQGNWSKAAKTATLQWRGLIVDATFMGSMELGQERLRNPDKWVGKKVTFQYYGLTGPGLPNYAKINPTNCFSADRS